MTDGYAAYKALESNTPSLKLAHCWAHVRRKFLDGADYSPELSEHAVKLIGELFKIEREVPRAGPGTTYLLAVPRLDARQ
jgi:transposase